MGNIAPKKEIIPTLSPEIKAGLIGIRYAEGTWKKGTDPKKGYNIMFGGSPFDNTKEHPNKVIYSGRYASAAAGAYQFMPGTWESVGGGVMTPERQDWGATRLWLAREGLSQDQHGANQLTRMLRVNKGISPNMAHKMAPEWASFPTIAGVSYYGQPVKPLSEINRAYHTTLPGYQEEERVFKVEQARREQVSKASQARLDDKKNLPRGTMAILGGKKVYWPGNVSGADWWSKKAYNDYFREGKHLHAVQRPLFKLTGGAKDLMIK